MSCSTNFQNSPSCCLLKAVIFVSRWCPSAHCTSYAAKAGWMGMQDFLPSPTDCHLFRQAGSFPARKGGGKRLQTVHRFQGYQFFQQANLRSCIALAKICWRWWRLFRLILVVFKQVMTFCKKFICLLVASWCETSCKLCAKQFGHSRVLNHIHDWIFSIPWSFLKQSWMILSGLITVHQKSDFRVMNEAC